MKNQILIQMFVIHVLLIAITIASSSPNQVLHRQKRACPYGYSSCSYGCCKNGGSCGYNYYPCSSGCCGPFVCPSGYTPCGTTTSRCCPVSTCPATYVKCDGDNTYGGSYCCPAGTGCCKPTYGGQGGLCCSITCPVNYTVCSYGCCPNKDTCGFGYYRCSSSSCCRVVCPAGYAACATGTNKCCRIRCDYLDTTCDQGINTYCCRQNYTCCQTYNSNYGGTFGACCPDSEGCGTPPQPCCTGNSKNFYGSFCNYGSCVNGYCKYGKK